MAKPLDKIIHYIAEEIENQQIKEKSYKEHQLELERQALIHQAKQNFYDTWYPTIVTILFKAINNTHAITPLLPVRNLDNIVSVNPVRMTRDVIYAECRGWYQEDSRKITAKKIQRILQSEFDQLCLSHGLPRFGIRVQLKADNHVVFRIIVS